MRVESLLALPYQIFPRPSRATLLALATLSLIATTALIAAPPLPAAVYIPSASLLLLINATALFLTLYHPPDHLIQHRISQTIGAVRGGDISSIPSLLDDIDTYITPYKAFSDPAAPDNLYTPSNPSLRGLDLFSCCLQDLSNHLNAIKSSSRGLRPLQIAICLQNLAVLFYLERELFPA